MPEDRRDPVRTFRIPPEEWGAALAVASKRGESLSQVIRDALKRYVTRNTPRT